VRTLASDPDDRFDLADDGRIRWRGAAVARLARGARPIAPAVEVLDSDLLAVADRETVRKRLTAWLVGHVADRLAPLVRLDEAKLSGPARGLAYQLVEALGTLARSRALDQARALGRIERGRLRELGVRLGFATLFLPALLKPAAVRLRALLWTTWQGGAPPAPAPGPGLVTVSVSGAVPDGFYEAVGYPVVDGRAVRADILERLGLALHTGARKGPVPLTPDLMSLAGLGAEETTRLVVGLGYRAVAAADGIQFVPGRRAQSPQSRGNGTANEAAKRRPGRGRKARRSRKADPGSPFAKLRELGIG
jgi:ATP-dependent RNA helicase SUPV3L1/SUV3